MPKDFSHQDLRGKSFKGQDLTGADFSYADIRGLSFKGAILTGTNFTNIKCGMMKRSFLYYQDLRGKSFKDQDLTGADFQPCGYSRRVSLPSV